MIFLGCRATGRGNAIPGPNSAALGVEMELLDYSFLWGEVHVWSRDLNLFLPGLEPVLMLLLLTDIIRVRSRRILKPGVGLHVPWANGA